MDVDDASPSQWLCHLIKGCADLQLGEVLPPGTEEAGSNMLLASAQATHTKRVVCVGQRVRWCESDINPHSVSLDFSSSV